VRSLGLRASQVSRSKVRLVRDLDATHTWLIQPVSREFSAAEQWSVQDRDRLSDDLRERSRTGRYFPARIYHSILATAV